jgi:hypothetical protein
MKSNQILKSLSELSPELLAVEAAEPEQIKPPQTQAVTQETQPTSPQPRSFPTGSGARGYQRWGLNE